VDSKQMLHVDCTEGARDETQVDASQPVVRGCATCHDPSQQQGIEPVQPASQPCAARVTKDTRGQTGEASRTGEVAWRRSAVRNEVSFASAGP
jgi:hypothetical protein